MGWDLVIWIGAIALLLLLAYRAVIAMRRGLDRLRDLAQMIEAGAQEAEVTPKSLSSMERLLLPGIRADFPEYDAQLMERRARQDALSFYQCLQRHMLLFEEDRGVRSFLEEMEEEIARRAGQVQSPYVHKAALSAYRNGGAQCFVTYQAACQYQEAQGRTLQTKLELTYIAAAQADMEQGISVYQCPNCGAPVSSIGGKQCEYCGTVLHPAAPLSWLLFSICEKG